MNIDTLRRTFPSGFLADQRKSFLTTSTNGQNVVEVATSTDYTTWTLTTAERKRRKSPI
mgnify:CR=1 FL=1